MAALPHATVYAAIYLIAFFGFFRISNLVPSATTKFDVKKQLCVGDVLFEQTYCAIVVKWSKTIRTPDRATYVILPRSKTRFCVHG